jgi:DNA-binding response OmpR family regulator
MLAAPAILSGRRVLVVDDHPDSAETACMLLSALGHVCSPVMSGEDALVEALRFEPHVVICDIGLPGISGYEVARMLRTRTGSQLYLAALTGWDQPADRARSFAAGFDQHVIKPASGKALRAIISASLRRLAIGTGQFGVVEPGEPGEPKR